MGLLNLFSKKEKEETPADPLENALGLSSKEILEILKDYYTDTDTERYLKFFLTYGLEDLPGQTDADTLVFYLSALQVRYEENSIEKIHLYPIEKVETELLRIGFEAEGSNYSLDSMLIKAGIESGSDFHPIRIHEKDGKITQIDTVRYSPEGVKEIRYEISYNKEGDTTIYENIDNRVKSLFVFDSLGRRHNSKGPAWTEYNDTNPDEEPEIKKYYWRDIFLGRGEEGAAALQSYVSKAVTPVEEKTALDQRNEEILKTFRS